ncbi:MAG: MBL fold metallo-hydrolase [Clostridia bacterium]|nr:MBL fold metallo-hydrolase [Clostridia bacterium]
MAGKGKGGNGRGGKAVRSSAAATELKAKNIIYYIVIAIIVLTVVAVAAIKYLQQSDDGGSTAESDPVSDREPVSSQTTSVDKLTDLKIQFIDVGQGDSALITFPDGKHMLIDGGKGNKTVEATLDKYLTVDGKKITIDYCVATHPDEDHIGSLDYVYENYDVLYSYRPFVYSGHTSSSVFSEYFNAGSDIGNKTKAYYSYLSGAFGDTPENWSFFKDDSDFTNTVTLGEEEYEYSVDFFMPYIQTYEDYSVFSDPNDFSAVIMIEYAGRKILFTGDIGNQQKNGSEKAFVDSVKGTRYESLADCDVLKVAHHGSKYSSTVEFLNIVKPEYAVISCGSDKNYKHPTKEALDNINSALMKAAARTGEAKLFRTDLQGTVTLTVNKDGEMSFSVDTNANDDYLLSEYEIVVANQDKIKK